MAGLDPLILAGDFNIKPIDHCYDLITKSVLPEKSAAKPASPEWETKADPDWKVELERLEYFLVGLEIYSCCYYNNPFELLGRGVVWVCV